MFQKFDVTTRPEQGPPRLAALRNVLEAEALDGFLIPRADAHRGEYVAPRDERLAWLTGFTGSAGFCVALGDKAGVFIDGRYRTQVRAQVDTDCFTPVPWPDTSMADWLKDALPQGGRIGFDPWLHTPLEVERAQRDLAQNNVEFVRCRNLVDQIWTDQPTPAGGAATVHPMEFAGETHASKCARLGADLAAQGACSTVLTLPDSICWLLNIRGSDIPHNPIVQCFAVLHQNGQVNLFLDPAKTDELQDHFGPEIVCHPLAGLLDYLKDLPGPVLLKKSSVPVAIADQIGDKVMWGPDPCSLPKACKNSAEIAGSVAAHLRDGAAVIETLAWLDQQAPGTVTETQVVTRLESERAKDSALRDISFETIAGTGANGAIIHYRVNTETDALLSNGQLLVLDSGGQYLDGTTDVTRTIAIGTPPREACEAFTRVLSGMIAMSRLCWPKGLSGRDIEAVARAPLWAAHHDFDHGLGHGVGAYLSVHEGPQRLSRTSEIPLSEGMILSNEPGYYKEGAFGIRIENLLVAEAMVPPVQGDPHREMLCWQTLTYVPIDRRLIFVDLLDAKDRDWLNAYHAQVVEHMLPRVSASAGEWLHAACAPL